MKILTSVFIFIFGLIVGSFLNSVIHRLSTKEGFFFKRSYCPHCKHVLGWQDLIPIFSFLTLGGKCRYCSDKISWQYPLVELATGFLFVTIFNQQLTLFSQQITFSIFNACFLFLATCFLIIIFVYDLKHYIIPDRVIYPAILVVGLWYLVVSIFFNFYTEYQLLTAIYSALGAAGFFLTIVLISRGQWMGVGDIKLAFLMGLLLGFPNILVALFLAFFIGAIIGVTLILFGKKNLKSEVPFAPFLIMGTFLAMFFGERIIDFYLSLFLLR
jgi:leader peptidase (prepilin peptidase)/N-methyltransferase